MPTSVGGAAAAKTSRSCGLGDEACRLGYLCEWDVSCISGVEL
jgi:hypothetical protein